jgi:hypothetical protein
MVSVVDPELPTFTGVAVIVYPETLMLVQLYV